MPIDLDQARAYQALRQERRQQAQNQRFKEAWQDFRAIVEMLIHQYQPQRIYQWGSLLNPKTFSERSDIDIAIEGITDPAQFFALYGEADQLARFPLDLVALEKIEPEFADIIRLKGMIIYDRDRPNPGPHFRN